MLKRYRLAGLAGLSAVCVVTLDARATPPAFSGPLQSEPVFELAQRVERRRLDGLPGRGPYCRDRHAKRYALCLLRAERQISPGSRQTASRACRFAYRYYLKQCQ